MPAAASPAEKPSIERHVLRGLRYDQGRAWMEAQHRRVLDGGPMQVALVEHDPWVVTLGRHADHTELLDPAALQARSIEVVHTDRGGGATAHGPGQLVLYPVVDLRRLGLSVASFTTLLEDVAIDLFARHGIGAEREAGAPGVYVDGRKVASVGFRTRRGVVTHGLAINVVNETWPFGLIKVCRHADREVTTLWRCLCRSDQDQGTFLKDQIDCTMKFFLDRAMLQ